MSEQHEAEVFRFGPITIALHASAATTGGAFSVLEERPPLVDTPLHIHANEDEFFFILEGEHVITIGSEEHRLGPGQGVFAARGVPHAQRRVRPGEGRLLVTYAPAGFEEFFRRHAEATLAGDRGDAMRAAASADFGITWL